MFWRRVAPGIGYFALYPTVMTEINDPLSIMVL